MTREEALALRDRLAAALAPHLGAYSARERASNISASWSLDGAETLAFELEGGDTDSLEAMLRRTVTAARTHGRPDLSDAEIEAGVAAVAAELRATFPDLEAIEKKIR